MAKRRCTDVAEGRVDLVALLAEQIDTFSFGERLRLAAGLLDDVKAHRSADPVAAVRHARVILQTVNSQLLDELRKLQ